MLNKIQKIYERIIVSSIKKADKVIDVEEWKRFIADLPSPTDAIEFSYNKYLCRMWYISKPKAFALNVASLCRLVGAIPSLMRKSSNMPPAERDKLVVVKRPTVKVDDLLPDELLASYERIVFIDLPAPRLGKISQECKTAFFACVRKHPFSFYYQLYVLKELSIHSDIIHNENPTAVAVYVNERNMASSILTDIYERSNRELVSFMHGEYILQLIQAFMVFTKYYVWDYSYIDIFENDLKCHCGQYIVYTPLKLKKKWNLENVEPDHFCTYYFSGESEKSIEAIAKIFHELNTYGLTCKVRPHPRDSHYDLIYKMFPKSIIEDSSEIDMRTSLKSTRYAVGLCSTALSEAWIEGRTAVIDDVSDPKAFSSLNARKFIGLSREHLLLSVLMDEVEKHYSYDDQD